MESGESCQATIYRFGSTNRSRRYGQLQRSDPFRSTPHSSRFYADRKLHVVTLHQRSRRKRSSSERVNQVVGNPYSNKSVGSYLNPTAFELPALGTLGNMGASSIAGPGYWQFDAAFSRTFHVREMQKVEFRAEAFNVTNAFH